MDTVVFTKTHIHPDNTPTTQRDQYACRCLAYHALPILQEIAQTKDRSNGQPHNSVMPDQSTNTTAICTVCQTEEVVSVNIGGDPLCEDCVFSGIIPQFINALKHEAAYPPAYGRYLLHPRDFAPFLKDADQYLALYSEKELEYNTPIATRLYCGNCQTFCGKKDEHRLIRLGCPGCRALICSACGLPDAGGLDHECERVSDPFEGLVRGKDFQICPNESCGMKIELRDGCNAIRCNSSSCLTEFCMICGEQADHDGPHWRAGSKCPRFNQPNAANALFDRGRMEDERAREEADFQRLLAQGAAAAAATAHANIDTDQLIADIDRFDLFNRDEVVRVLGRVALLLHAPLPPILARDPVERLTAEAELAVELEATPLAALMRHQQGQLDALVQVAETMIADHEAAGRQVPAFLPAVVDGFVKLRMNLDMYIWRERLHVGWADFRRRHEEMDPHNWVLFAQDIVQHFPMFVRIMHTYALIALPRMTGAHAARLQERLEQVAAAEGHEEVFDEGRDGGEADEPTMEFGAPIL